MRRFLLLIPILLPVRSAAGGARRAAHEAPPREAADPYAQRPGHEASAADKLAWAARVVGEMEAGSRDLEVRIDVARAAGREAEAACLDEQRAWLLALREAGHALQDHLADALARGRGRLADRAVLRLATTLAAFRDTLADTVRCRTRAPRPVEGVQVTVGLAAGEGPAKR